MTSLRGSQQAKSAADDGTWDLIVIGAGAAGLACSRVTQCAGLRVLVLEARDRCGGRAWSCDSLEIGVEVDHGAGWVHSSCPGNPMLSLATLRGVEASSDNIGASCVIDIGAGKVIQSNALAPYFAAVEDAYEEATAETEKRPAKPEGGKESCLLDAMVAVGLPLNFGESVTEELASRTGEGRKTRGKKKTKLNPQLLRWALSAEVERDEGFDAEELSAAHVDAGLELPGGNSVIRGGYGAFVRTLVEGPLASISASGAGTLDVRMGDAVKVIKWDAELQGVEVTTVAGKSYFARRALVAVPLGVLKAGNVSFVPDLPERKKAAIESLGCAAMTKVFFRFPRRFWAAGATGWGLCGTDAQQQTSIFERAFFFPYFQGRPDGDVRGESVLCALLYGKAARAVEDLSEEEIGNAVFAALSRAAVCPGAKKLFLGAVQMPSAISVSRWNTDPYARCCWTAFIVGSSPADCEAIAKPLGANRRLSFAGEHTVVDDMGTVHGAWLSGLREAERILMECTAEGRFATGPDCACATEWMLHCREAAARAEALREYDDDSSSEESSSDDEE